MLRHGYSWLWENAVLWDFSTIKMPFIKNSIADSMFSIKPSVLIHCLCCKVLYDNICHLRWPQNISLITSWHNIFTGWHGQEDSTLLHIPDVLVSNLGLDTGYPDRFFSDLPYKCWEISPPREAASCAATQELSSILWNPKVHYCVHKSAPLVPILSQITPVHTIPSYLRSILI
jgi:hypothetical protein